MRMTSRLKDTREQESLCLSNSTAMTRVIPFNAEEPVAGGRLLDQQESRPGTEQKSMVSNCKVRWRGSSSSLMAFA